MAINFTVHVVGEPKGQPRGRAVSIAGHARVYDPKTAEGWKSRIAQEVRHHVPSEPGQGAFDVSMDFIFRRPKSHLGTGRNAGKLKPSAPQCHVQTPDVDNLAKAVLDTLTQLGFWRDDRQVDQLDVGRSWDDGFQGMWLTVRERVDGMPG